MRNILLIVLFIVIFGITGIVCFHLKTRKKNSEDSDENKDLGNSASSNKIISDLFDEEKLIKKWTEAYWKNIPVGDGGLYQRVRTPNQIRSTLKSLYPDITQKEIDFTVDFSNTEDGRPKFDESEDTINNLVNRWNFAVKDLTARKKPITYDTVFGVMSLTQYIESIEKEYIIKNNWINSTTLFSSILPNSKPVIINDEYIERQKISEFLPTWKEAKIAKIGENFQQILESSSEERINTIRNEIVMYLRNRNMISEEMQELIYRYDVI